MRLPVCAGLVLSFSATAGAGPTLERHHHGPREFWTPVGSDISFDTRSDEMTAMFFDRDPSEDNAHDQYLHIAVVDGDDVVGELARQIAKGTFFPVKGWTCVSGTDPAHGPMATCARQLSEHRINLVTVDGNGLSLEQAATIVADVAPRLKGYGKAVPPWTDKPQTLPKLVTYKQNGISFKAPQGWFAWVVTPYIAEAFDRPFRFSAYLDIGTSVRPSDDSGLDDLEVVGDWHCGTASSTSWRCTKPYDAEHGLIVDVGGNYTDAVGRAFVRKVALSLKGMQLPPSP